MNDIKQEIGRQLQQRRKELSVKQSDVQDYTNISPATLSNIEQGKSNYTIDNLLAILDVLGLEIRIKIKEV